MTYIFMAVHYPEPGWQDGVYESMRAMAGSMAGTPGLLEIGPWLDRDGDRVVGLARWQSREAFEAAMPGSGVAGSFTHEGESRPREYVHLLQPDAVPPGPDGFGPGEAGPPG
ncbi:MAG: antibiotic biosynthesis monooxygenase [Streptosporangiaceae bacterium]